MKIITALIVLTFSFPVFAMMTTNEAACGMPGTGASPKSTVQEFAIIAKNYQYLPNTIVLRKGVPARLYFTSVDRSHDVKIEEMQIREEVAPGKVTILNFTPQKTGAFEYTCDVYCGPGHRGMKGKIIVM